MKFTYYGHACFKVEIGGKHILFDPFISGNELAADKVNIDEIQADYILLSHGHQDHVLDLESIAKRCDATVVAAYEVALWANGKGIEKYQPMNHGGKWKFDWGTVKATNAVHSSVLPDGSYGGNPMGFVIESEEGNFYYAGDTALTMDMKLIPMTCAKLDFAIMPIGDCFTMGVEDALMAAEFVQCPKVIGVHYDTFGFIKIDHEQAKKQFEDRSMELILMEIGESRDM